MEDFVVSARKYRPKTFDTVIGQEKITETLIRSIENNHLAHAFLFCGPRGVGKTTCARIMARAVNQHGIENAKIDDDFSFNIFELDAASNNKVEDIRSLIDQVRIPPQVGKYKVYIIDEVHMLSSSAFNAFLKTLEEPPPYAIFILATTEKHKVLPTILSRCQVFDFNRIQIPEMVAHLSKIAEKEGIKAEDDALHVIAEKADGALRDALSIFDQMVSFSGNNLTYTDVISHLNVLDYDYYFAMTDAFLIGNSTGVLVAFNEILNKGFNGHHFVTGLASHYRNLLFSVSKETANLLEVGDNVRQKYLEQAQKCDTKFLLNAISLLSETDVNYNTSRNPRLLVEITLLKICALKSKFEEKKNNDSDVVSNDSPAKASKPEIRQHTSVQSGPGIDSVTSATVSTQETHTPTTQTGENKQTHSPAKTTYNPPQAQPPTSVSEPHAEKKSFSQKLGSAKIVGMASINSQNTETDKNKKENNTAHQDVDPSLPVDEKPRTDFNMAQLWNVWSEYSNGIKESDRQSYYATLSKRQPILKDDFMVEFLIDNEMQKIDIEHDKANLLGFLREKLNNWQIRLKVCIDDDDELSGDNLYSPDAKFRAMAEHNNALHLFKEQFDLEVDYDS